MRHNDTVDKIVEIYLGGLCREEFSYKGRRFSPKQVVISPLLTRGYTCPSGCGACCGSFSLDYLPTETASDNATRRTVKLDGRQVELLSDKQDDVQGRWCRHLDKSNGRCGIYSSRPFACDFELIRLLMYEEKVVVTQKLYGRAWAMLRLDDNKGAACEMLPSNPGRKLEVIRKLRRLEEWATYFGIRTCIPEIIDRLEEDDTYITHHLSI